MGDANENTDAAQQQAQAAAQQQQQAQAQQLQAVAVQQQQQQHQQLQQVQQQQLQVQQQQQQLQVAQQQQHFQATLASQQQQQQQQQLQTQAAAQATQQAAQLQQMGTPQPTTQIQQLGAPQQQPQIQQISGWEHGQVGQVNQVQLIQQQVPNQSYVQYGQAPILMQTGNLATLQPNSNQKIQLIAGNPMIAQGQTPFSSFQTIPTSNNQAILIGNFTNQPNLIQAQSVTAVATSNKQQDLQKFNAYGANRAIPQGAQSVQFPWQFNTPIQQATTANLWATATASPQPAIIGTQLQNGLFIHSRRSPQQDGTGQIPQGQVFIQSPPPQHGPGILQNSQSIQSITQVSNAANTMKRPQENIQPKMAVTRAVSILPSGATAIRPGSSVSTQTTSTIQIQPQMIQKSQTKSVRPKAVTSRTGVSIAVAQKSDAGNQTKMQLPQQHMAGQNRMVTLQYVQDNKVQIQQQPVQQSMKIQQVQPAQPQQVQQQLIPQPVTLQTAQQQHPQQMIIQRGGGGMPTVMVQLQQQPHMQQLHPQQQQAVANAVAQQQHQQQQQQAQVQAQHQQQAQVQAQQQAQQQAEAQAAVVQQQVQQQQQLQQLQQQQQQQPQTITISNIVQQPLTSEQQQIAAQQVPEQIMPPVIAPVKVETGNDANNEQKIDPSINQIQQTVMNGVPVTQMDQLPPEKSIAVEGMLTLAATGTTNLTAGAPTVEEDVKDKMPPKAFVKPNVLVHKLGDHLILEADEPFPPYSSSLISELSQSTKNNKENRTKASDEEEPSPKKQKTIDGEFAKCEHCNVELKGKMKKSKRFCTSCSKRYNTSYNKRYSKGENGTDSKDSKNKDWDGNENNDSGAESSSTPSESMDVEENGLSEASSTNNDASKSNPWKWTVTDVCDFIKKLPEASDYVEEFSSHEIDGQALMLLKENHLISVMNMKLGLALKIVNKINALREPSPSQNERS